MELLAKFGVHSDLPKNEFVGQLVSNTTSSLRDLRRLLFQEASNLGLLDTDLVDIPLVERCDTAIRPASTKLSDDIWTIVQCTCNLDSIPRTLLRNGKRSKDVLTASQRGPVPLATQQNRRGVQQNRRKLSPTESQASFPSTHLIFNKQGVVHPLSTQGQTMHTTTVLEKTTIQPQVETQHQGDTPSQSAKTIGTPSQSSVSDHFISREIDHIKNDIKLLKTEVSSLRNNLSTCNTSEPSFSIGYELKGIKDELSRLRQGAPHLTHRISPPSPHKTSSNTYPTSTITDLHVVTWNCRGVSTATPYINHLINKGTNIIALTEHWLWPYQLSCLNQLHPDFTSFGQGDKRLNEKSDLSKGCGGVSLIWKKSLNAKPISDLQSDRICGVQLDLEASGLSMRSANYPMCIPTQY